MIIIVHITNTIIYILKCSWLYLIKIYKFHYEPTITTKIYSLPFMESNDSYKASVCLLICWPADIFSYGYKAIYIYNVLCLKLSLLCTCFNGLIWPILTHVLSKVISIIMSLLYSANPVNTFLLNFQIFIFIILHSSPPKEKFNYKIII